MSFTSSNATVAGAGASAGASTGGGVGVVGNSNASGADTRAGNKLHLLR